MYYRVVLGVSRRVDESALDRIGRALADESRRRILIELLDGPAYPAELAQRLGLGKANTSNHLSCLRGCGLVLAEPEGRKVRYELADERLADGLRMLVAVVVTIDPDCRRER
jgi:DNA-binding transcriptional ArsR family regulator